MRTHERVLAEGTFRLALTRQHRLVAALDAETALVGMQPSVAITLVEMGVTMTGIRTALNVERGMALLRANMEKERADDEAPEE